MCVWVNLYRLGDHLWLNLHIKEINSLYTYLGGADWRLFSNWTTVGGCLLYTRTVGLLIFWQKAVVLIWCLINHSTMADWGFSKKGVIRGRGWGASLGGINHFEGHDCALIPNKVVTLTLKLGHDLDNDLEIRSWIWNYIVTLTLKLGCTLELEIKSLPWNLVLTLKLGCDLDIEISFWPWNWLVPLKLGLDLQIRSWPWP